MATAAIFLVKQLAVTLLFGYVFGYHFFSIVWLLCIFIEQAMWQIKTFQNFEINVAN